MAELTETPSSSCCSPEAQGSCCEPSAKETCCGTAAAGGSCGCAAGQAEPAEDIRENVRERYAAAARAVAERGDPSCGCSSGDVALTDEQGVQVFGSALYDGEAQAAPAAAVEASLGCGVPTEVADLHEGETVLDLGFGGGGDVLISARRVGPGRPGDRVDMTDEMLALARANAARGGVENVEFVKGYIEEIPLADASVDVVISNCVINLAADKRRVAEEARVLRPGGRFAVSDVLADPDMDEATRADMAAYTGCIAGALTEDEFRGAGRRRPGRRRDPPDAPRPRARRVGDRPGAQAVTATRLQLNDPQTLYRRWEDSQWSPFAIDLGAGPRAVDVDGGQRSAISSSSRPSSLMVAEERITTKFSGLVAAHGTEEEATFLATQQVDEARHMQFYARFQDEVIAAPGGDRRARRRGRASRSPTPSATSSTSSSSTPTRRSSPRPGTSRRRSASSRSTTRSSRARSG